MRFVIAIIVSLLVCLMIKVTTRWRGIPTPHAHATASRHVEVEESWPQLPQRTPRPKPPDGPAITASSKKGGRAKVAQELQNNNPQEN